MNNIYLVLTALLLVPTAALAESDDSLLNNGETSDIAIEDATDETMTPSDQHRLDPQNGDLSTDNPDLNSVDNPTKAAGPFIVAPKFDFGAGLPAETDTTINPYEPVPEPAPGFVIRIPTN
jgi:hypothetical protein